MTYSVLLNKQAKKDVDKLSPKLRAKLRVLLLDVLSLDPFRGKALLGNLEGYFSYRLTFKDRIVYRVDAKKKLIFVLRVRTHYGE
jgi:mRNA interferase RelE/StbE